MALSHSPKITTSGLVFCLDAANSRSYPGSGTSCSDISGSGITGTLTNGVSYSSVSKGYFSFDSTDDYIDTSASTTLDTMTAFTVNVWMKTGAGLTERGVITKGPVNEFSGVVTDGWSLRVRQGVPGFALRKADDSGYFDIFNGTNVENDTWCMITGVFDSTSLKRYFNGTLEQNNGTGGVGYLQNDHSLKIGILGNKPFDGEISSVMIYNRGLTTAEILQNYQATRDRYGV